MAVVADKVIVELEARLGQYNANIAAAEAKFDKSMKGIQASAGKTEAVVSRAASLMSTALAGVSVLALAKSFLAIADSAKKLDAQLRLATATYGAFGQAQEDVRRIADDTRSGLEETAKLYGNFVRGAQALGASQADASRATETFSKSLKISGAGAAEAASATLQFGQALASGVLRGDEFNSVMESSPRLARLLADSLGVPVGALRKMAEEGELTADKLLRALTDQKFTAGIDAEFKQIPVTFDDAMTQVSNAAMVTFSAFDRGGEFSTMLANFVGDGADGFASLETSAENFGITVSSNMAGAIAVLMQVVDAVNMIGGAFEWVAGSPIGRLIARVNELAGYLNPVGLGLKALGMEGGAFQSARASQANQLRMNQQDRQSRAFLTGGGRFDVMGNPVAGTPGGRLATPTATTSGGKTKKTRTPKSKLDPEAFSREEADFNDQILRLKEDEVKSISERTNLARQRVENDRADTAVQIRGSEKYTEAQKEILLALNDQVAAARNAKIMQDGYAEAIKRTAEAQGNSREYAIAALRAQADMATTYQQKRDIELRILELMQEEERQRLETLIAEGKVADAAKARADLAAQQSGERTLTERDNEGPLARYARGLNETDTQAQVEGYVVQELDYVRDGIRGALSEAIGTKDPLINGLLNMFIEQVIMRPLANALSGAGGGGGLFGSVIGLGMSFLGFASGGSMSVGGRGGTDTNTLSLNGRPIANVSRGETLNIGSKTLKGGGGMGGSTIYVDARGAVMNDQFAQQILSMSASYTDKRSVQAGQAAYQQSLRDSPGYIRKGQRYGQI